MTKVVVLGCGMVGAAIATDLVGQGLAVTVADVRQQALDRVKNVDRLTTLRCDLADPAALSKLIAPFDVVCGALASTLGFQTLRTVIEAKKSYCDISFMEEDPLSLDALAKENGVTAVVDCGVAPGLGNVCAGAVAHELSPCERIDIFVGGLPQVRSWPFYYKAPYAPTDVFEIYTRPSRVVEHGKIVVKEALSEPELLEFAGVGTLEAFNTDGLRSLTTTLKVPFMREKTLRYPGHIELMRVLKHTGFFAKEPITVGGTKVSPLEVSEALLLPKWAFAEGEADLTVMRIVGEGTKNGRRVRRTWDLLDRYDPATKLRSMSRTTAFPASIITGMLARGELSLPGVVPPELLAPKPGFFGQLLAELDKRGVRMSTDTVVLDD
ncbi:MAG: saccharopine dehydrogenase [Polyangiaceae bacterium]|nr:saccharopine dehydrogenase [Polyangiaceae bacterium]